jgi:hypothetical protein
VPATLTAVALGAQVRKVVPPVYGMAPTPGLRRRRPARRAMGVEQDPELPRARDTTDRPSANCPWDAFLPEATEAAPGAANASQHAKGARAKTPGGRLHVLAGALQALSSRGFHRHFLLAQDSRDVARCIPPLRTLARRGGCTCRTNHPYAHAAYPALTTRFHELLSRSSPWHAPKDSRCPPRPKSGSMDPIPRPGTIGLRFKCTMCGNCCTGPEGYVLVTDATRLQRTRAPLLHDQRSSSPPATRT